MATTETQSTKELPRKPPKSTSSMESNCSVNSKDSKKKLVMKIKAREKIIPETTFRGRIIILLVYTFLFAYAFIILFSEAFILPRDQLKWCRAAQRGVVIQKSYENPDHDADPCRYERVWHLLFLNRDECDFGRRMIASVILGAVIGYERKTSDRPAGIRTMSLVCLGACFFTVSSQRAFKSSTMGWDAARVSAAIPSGVGFLGAGLIWKGTTGQKGTPDERHEVHGLTTAASVWLSAAVGVGTGGRLYIVSVYATALVILVLRLGPRIYFTEDSSYMSEDEEDWDESNHSNHTNASEFEEEGDRPPITRTKSSNSNADIQSLSLASAHSSAHNLSRQHSSAHNLSRQHSSAHNLSRHAKDDLYLETDTPTLPACHIHKCSTESNLLEIFAEEHTPAQYSSSAFQSTFDEITNSMYDVPLNDHNMRRGRSRTRSRRRHHKTFKKLNKHAPNFCS